MVFRSVDSSWVHGPASSDVCSMQRHWTAHPSQPQAPLNKHIHPGPISEMHFGAAAAAAAAPRHWHPQKKKSTITILESCNEAWEYKWKVEGGKSSAGRGCNLTFSLFSASATRGKSQLHMQYDRQCSFSWTSHSCNMCFLEFNYAENDSFLLVFYPNFHPACLTLMVLSSHSEHPFLKLLYGIFFNTSTLRLLPWHTVKHSL